MNTFINWTHSKRMSLSLCLVAVLLVLAILAMITLPHMQDTKGYEVFEFEEPTPVRIWNKFLSLFD